ncbi:START-like domain [Phytophthora cactorum]|nr:START-like domain [Phytophthora cactorum]
MTKFPLEHAPFLPIHLIDSDKEALLDLADTFVTETIEDYERHLRYNNGIVDSTEWVRVKQFEDVVVYEDRRALKERRLSRVSSSRAPKRNGNMLKLLWAGTIRGDLDDVMYAAVNRTAEDAKVKAAYVESNCSDFAVLNTLVGPTVNDPFRSVQIKWTVNAGPPMMRSVVRSRDFVYLESTGMTTTSTGERIGFQLLHSISIPGAPELHEHKLVRGNMSLFHFFRQKSDGIRRGVRLETRRVRADEKAQLEAQSAASDRPERLGKALPRVLKDHPRQYDSASHLQDLHAPVLRSLLRVQEDVFRAGAQSRGGAEDRQRVHELHPDGVLTVNSEMKFPLAHAPFGPLRLSEGDRKEAVELADVFVQQTLADYETHLEVQHGVVDEVRWKMVKRFEDVVVYQDREAMRPRRLTLASSSSGSGYEHRESPNEMQKLLWFGTVQGSLDEIMYGVANPTAEEAKVKAAFVGSNVLDFAVLDTIVHPTVDDPFRGLQIKWAVNGGPSMMRSMVRCRDFVYLESTGMTTNSKGERIGYHILHSIAMPGAPELHEHKIIRGNMTLYHLYRQKSEGVVETYVTAFIDVMGDMPSSIATFVSAKGVVSVWKLGDYAEMKKLMWLLKQHKTVPPNLTTPAPAASLGGSAKNPLQRVLWHGTINCDLDDLMLGIVNQNADMWKVKSSYVEDNGLDYFLLASIKERTVEKPFEGLQLKWTVNDMGPLMAKPIMRPRDFVFMESTGITQSPTTGERMGYHICHSLELPGVPELPNYKLVRGKHELYHIFRQKSKGIVEVYVRALCDLQGEMPSTSVSLFSAEAMSTLTLSAFCAERHKVMWLLHTMVPCESGKPSLDLCSVCTKDLSKSLLPFMNKACRLGPAIRRKICGELDQVNNSHGSILQTSLSYANVPMDPACPFETPLSLSERDRRSMQRLAQRCIDETMVDYEHVLSSKSGLPNVTRWKPVKKKENIVVYEDQLAIEEIKRRKRKAKSLGDIIESTRVGDILTRSVGPGAFRPSATAFTRETEVSEPKEMPKMIWMGTVECELDDLMYGLVSQSDEVTRIKSSYSGNSIQDFATLASLEISTASDPFRGLQLKWEVNRALTKAKPVWRCRDFVYLEATGVTKSRSTGQRIGYQILHSLDVRGVPELPGRKLTRGKVTIYQLFRQKSKGTVEVFAKAMVDLAGDVPTSMASLATIEAASARSNMCLGQGVFTSAISVPNACAIDAMFGKDSASSSPTRTRSSLSRRRSTCAHAVFTPRHK